MKIGQIILLGIVILLGLLLEIFIYNRIEKNDILVGYYESKQNYNSGNERIYLSLPIQRMDDYYYWSDYQDLDLTYYHSLGIKLNDGLKISTNKNYSKVFLVIYDPISKEEKIVFSGENIKQILITYDENYDGNMKFNFDDKEYGFKNDDPNYCYYGYWSIYFEK